MAGDAPSPRPCSFQVQSDRSASDLEAFEWNPSMDLLACLTTPPDSSMVVYRLLSEDQSPKLLSEKITGIGSALAWSPCGRRIAVGDCLGGVSIYDGESGAVLRSSRLHTRPVVALSWVSAETAGGQAAVPSWPLALPPLLPVPSAPSNMYACALDADPELDDGGGAFTLLASVDDSGLAVVSAGGTLALQAVPLFPEQAAVPSPVRLGCQSPASPAPLSPAAALGAAGVSNGERPARGSRRPRACRLSPDLRCLAVLLGPPATSSSSAPRSPLSELPVAQQSSPGGTCLSSQVSGCGNAAPWAASAGHELVLLVDVRKLVVRRRELAQFSRLAERLKTVIGYARQAVDALAKVWRGAVEGFAGKMRGLSEAADMFADSDALSIHEELVASCCLGRPTDAVRAFLTRQTSPQQLARLERVLMQALEYIQFVTCSRLQVATQHIFAVLQELEACASWSQKFGGIGLEPGPVGRLLSDARDFLRLTELLLLECSQARRFARTLLQVLLRVSRSLPDQSGAPPETGAAVPAREDMDDFVDRMRGRQPLDLPEVAARIGPAAAPAGCSSAAAGAASGAADGAEGAGARPTCLAGALGRLAAAAEELSGRVVTAVSCQAAVMACLPVSAAPPWASMAAPEFRAVAHSDAAAGVPCPRGLGHPTLSMTWESIGEGPDSSRLMLLWSGGGGAEAHLHLCSVELPLAVPGAPVEPQLKAARLRVGGLRPEGASPSARGHFVHCQVYSPGRVAALALLEDDSGEAPSAAGTRAVVCLVEVPEQSFKHVASLAGGPGQLDSLVPATALSELPEGDVRMSAPLPSCYAWASAMRVTSSRGVCSVYAWRARRLLTLDLEADPEDDCDDDEAVD